MTPTGQAMALLSVMEAHPFANPNVPRLFWFTEKEIKFVEFPTNSAPALRRQTARAFLNDLPPGTNPQRLPPHTPIDQHCRNTIF